MTTVAEEDVLTVAELELVVEPDVAKAELPADTAAQAAVDVAGEPLFRILKGSPTDQDIAALVAVLSAASADAPVGGPNGPADAWGNSTLMHRGTNPFSPYVYPMLSHLR
ncbi:acyl-CoA carboxylase epsilon subunit [Nocardia alba]|uniref:Acyl-CoA carboxylase epsilon subunit-like protein n=1 Tax=Nocardia alba TaxID=225051 RepID=A0A4R1FI92_9NOCA|nr:acyl-CoA carboxylase epsilon subunit [Nocardia alba]TCJ94536.1 acyl-CoA carboxylase epsilon subunit-like protein [Nocardia alba]